LFVLPLSLFHLENHVCLSRGVQVAGATWRTAMRIMAEVGDLIQRTGDDRTGRVLSGRMIERSGGVMCGLHCARGDEERGFLIQPQNQGRRFSPVWPQNRWRQFLPVWPQNQCGFLG
jgi:hypothetical protein